MKNTAIVIGLTIFLAVLAIGVFSEYQMRQEVQRESQEIDNIAECMVLTGKSGDWCERRLGY